VADQKLTALTETSSANAGDILYLVGDTGGTPVSLKVSKKNLLKEYATTGNLLGKVDTSTTIVTLYPMTGGLTLASSMTLSVDTAFLVNTGYLGFATSSGYVVVFQADTRFSAAKVLTTGSSTSVRTDATAIYIDATTATPIAYAPSGGPYLTWSDNGVLSAEKVLTAGSSVTLTSDATTVWINALTNAASGIAYAPTGGEYVVYVANNTLSAEKVLTAGTNVTITTDATTIWVNADTAAAGAQRIYAPTGGEFVVWVANDTLTAEKLLSAGSSVSIHTSATAIYINATTATPVVYAPTGGFYISFAADANLSAEKVLTAGSSVTIRTDATTVWVDATTATPIAYAPSGGPYLTWSDNGVLSAELVLKAGSSVTLTSDATSVYVNATTAAGAGTVSTGTATNLAFYKAADTTVYPSDISETTGTGIASLNLAFLAADPASPSNGDVWILSTGGGVYLRARTNTTTVTIAFA
jgi:hypothetical protein